jgi:hypothetical protein
MDRYICVDHLWNHNPPQSTDVYSLPQAVEAWRRGYTRLNIRETAVKSEDTLTEYLRFAGQIEDYYLVIDEVHKWVSANYIPSVFDDFVQTHTSHGNVGLIVASRQATPIPRSVWNECNNYFIFHYGGGRDAKIEKLEMAEEHKQKIHRLDKHEYLFATDRTGHTPEVCPPVPLPSHLTDL